MVLQNTWDELKRSRKCVSCGQTFKYGTAYRSKVSDGKQLNREEFCPECWDQKADQEYLYFWKGKYEPPARQPKNLTSKEIRQIIMEGIHSLQAKISEFDEEKKLEQLEILYLMMLFAERKKWVHFVKSEILEDIQTEIYESASGDEKFQVAVPHSIKHIMLDVERLKQYHERIENFLGIAISDLR